MAFSKYCGDDLISMQILYRFVSIFKPFPQLHQQSGCAENSSQSELQIYSLSG